ncbi:MAG: FAD-dependent oxidoreductase [Firmicutes bacterium]|nr:FAD-dependent oxidoreductase [Bacillota bacterium]
MPFTPPEWAYVFPDEESLPHRHHAIGEPYWWMEWGGTLDTVRDNETIRWELTRIALGVWDHVKNRCVHKERAANYTLEWLGAVVGKRESRRFAGDWTLTQKDIEEATLFPDRIAYGGWPIDLHPPEGIFSPEEPAMQRFLRRLYSIPLRSCYSSEVTNLFLAGRLISVSHVAVVVSWVVGTAVILYSAGLDGIPGELLEAAAIDGTSPWQRFRYVTLPLLKPTTLYVLVTQTIGAFQTFIVVQLLTRGGPAYRTYTLVYDIYVTAFQFFDFGYAAAQGVILLLLAGAVAILQIRFMRGDITY